MTDEEYASKVAELDHLLGDPDALVHPDRVWCLLAELTGRDLADLPPVMRHPGVRAPASAPAIARLGAAASPRYAADPPRSSR